MIKKQRAQSIHAPTGGWIALVLTAALMIAMGFACGARDEGLRSAYAPKGMDGETRIRVDETGLRIDLNRADRELLMTLPGIGSARADAIVAYRLANGAFESVEELTRVTGIGEKILDGLSARVFVDERINKSGSE